MPGPPKKPEAVKALRGTSRKDRQPKNPGIELDMTEDLPEPPEWLPNHFALTEWNRLVPLLFKFGLLTKVSITPLGHLCAIHGRLLQMYQGGVTPPASLVGQYRTLVNDFGMTPAGAAKIPDKNGNENTGKFKNNGFRRSKRY